MGWIWSDDNETDEANSFDVADIGNPNMSPSRDSAGDHCSTRRIVQSNCNTEEVEPGKFIRKCEKTEKILRDCVGKPTEIVQSNKEYTEEDVTHEMKQESSVLPSDRMRPFEFPGLRSDIEAIERSVSGSFSRFFEAADAMSNEFFRMLDDPSLFGGQPSSSSPSRRQEIPIEGSILKEQKKPPNLDSGDVDLSGLARDV